MEQTNPCLWPEFSDKHDAFCVDCGQQIEGSMFVCNLCEEHRICSSCYNESVVNETLHTRQSQEMPEEHPHMPHSYRLEMSKFGKLAFPVHEKRCASCRSPVYPGLRYVCPEICPDYGICATCFIKKKETQEIEYFEALQAEPKLEKLNEIGSAIVSQKFFGIGLAKLDWIKTDSEDQEQAKKLARKIGFAIYQYPTQLPAEERKSLDKEQLENLLQTSERDEQHRKETEKGTKSDKKKKKDLYESQFGYTEKEEKHIITLRDEIFEINRKNAKRKQDEPNILKTKFVFVSFFSEGGHPNILPLICLQINETKTVFVEPSGRAYDCWADFLDRNKLPECFIVYPSDGTYEMEDEVLNLRFDLSRRNKLPSKIVKVSDRSAMGIGIAATVGSVIGLFTPLAPLAATTLLYTAIGTGVYTMARSGYHIVDKATHNENVNPLRSRENFVDWLAVAASLASFGAIGGSAYLTVMATQGVEVSQAIECTVNAAIFANFAVSGLALTASGYNIFEKRPSALELFQFSTSLLFFTNAAVNLQTAEKMIQQASQDKINEVRESLKNAEDKQHFDQTINENMKKVEGKPGNAKTNAHLETIREMHKAMVADKHVDAHIPDAVPKAPAKSKPMPSASVPKTLQVKPLSPNDKKIVEEHLKNLESRGEATLPVSKQTATTLLNIPWNELVSKVKAVLSGGAGGAIVEKVIDGSRKRTVTLENGEEGFSGTRVEPAPNGVTIKKGILEKVEFILNENGEPVPYYVQGILREGPEQKLVRIRLENRSVLGRFTAKPKVRMYPEDETKGVSLDDRDFSDSYFMCYDWSQD